MDQYEISVIVPVYNAEPYLRQCVDSILEQTFGDLEIILVDDGSTDGCSGMINEYAAKYNNIVAIHQENGGLASARVTGLKNASGKYIGWVDADDFVDPDMYEKLYNCLVTNDADYAYCDYRFYPRKAKNKEKWFKQYNGTVDWDYIERNTQAWNTLTSHALLREIDLVELYPILDEYSWIAVLLNAQKTIVLNEALYNYRVGIESMSGGSFKGKLAKFQRQIDLSDKLPILIKGTPYEDSLEEYFAYRHIYTLLQLAIVAAVNGDRDSYQYAKNKLFEAKYRKNKLTKIILDNNHGMIKSFVLRNVIPTNYFVARRVVAVAL